MTKLNLISCHECNRNSKKYKNLDFIQWSNKNYCCEDCLELALSLVKANRLTKKVKVKKG